MKQHTASTRDWFPRALIAASVLTFLLVMAGYLIRFDGVNQACPDWPTCYGQWGIPGTLAARLEMGHRILAVAGAISVLGTGIWAFFRKSTSKLIRFLLAGASAFVIFESLAGSSLVEGIPSRINSSLHLGLALLIMALVTAAAVSANLEGTNVSVPHKKSFSNLARASAFAVFILMISGGWLASTGGGTACVGWPLCANGFPTTAAGWLAFGHRLLSLAAGVLVLAVGISAWKRHYHQPVLLTSATGAGLLFAGQVLISALKVSRGYPTDLVALHAAASAALWGVMTVLVVAAAREPVPADPVLEGKSRAAGKQRFKAFVALNKPIIVALLLVTTYAGMVVGGKQIPSLSLTLWTLIGGALAAGGASALNQVIDRELDGRMQRTAKRPLPSGALTTAEGLAYGLGACLAAFFLLAGFVNLLSAVLSLAGMIYYVLVYSVWLKHATVQNIVIGGGAGAIPPLVGWAAATGSLNIPSLFLFAIVFMWTPPHFWSLAIVRKNDYARAGVPMLPVIKGEQNARVQIFIYTLELVALTLLMPIFKITGSLFLVSALILGAWIIYAAWKVLRKPGNKAAWMMYRYSSMYLAFIFLALMVDVLV
jgi:protoheme IX farnesyltransferase